MSNTPDLDSYIDAAAAALAIPVKPEWKPEIRAHLTVSFRFATLVGEKELPNDAEPAPVFKA